MSLWSILSGKDAREDEQRWKRRAAEIDAEMAEINATGRYTTTFRWPGPMCLRCGAVVGDRDLHDAWHDQGRNDRA